MPCYLFKQENEDFSTKSILEIDSKDNFNKDDEILIVTKEKLFKSIITEVEENKIIFNNLQRIEIISVEFEKYIIEILNKEKDKVELDSKYQYLLQGKQGAISTLEYLKIIKRLTKNEKKIFRGHASVKWKLQASLYRGTYKLGKEHELRKEVEKFNFDDFKKQSNFINTLCRMQHYGIPTTLLDWSKDSLIVLFFACQPDKNDNKEENDGEIISLSAKQIHQYDSEKFLEFNSLLELQYQVRIKLVDSYSESNLLSFLLEVYKTKNNLFFIETIFENARITSQNGLFSFFFNADLNAHINVKKQLIKQIYILKNREIFNSLSNKMHSDFGYKLDNILYDMSILRGLLSVLADEKENVTIEELKANNAFIGSCVKETNWKYNEIESLLTEIENYLSFEIRLLQTILEKTEINTNDIEIYSIIIPGEKKGKILLELKEMFNIHFVTVYPDINGFSQYLKAKYN